MKLWTVWIDYSATGEGRSLMAYISYAKNELDARKKFASQSHARFSAVAEAQEGLVVNEVTKYLFSMAALTSIKQAEGRAMVRAFASIHVNYN